MSIGWQCSGSKSAVCSLRASGVCPIRADRPGPGEGSLLGSRVARSRGMSVSIAHTIDSPPLLPRSADAPPVNVVDADAAAASYTTCCCCCCAYRKGSRAKLRDSRLEALSRRELPAAATGVRRIHASFCASTTTTRLVAASSF